MSKMTRLPYPGGSTSPGMSPFWVTIQIGARGEGFSAPLRALVDTDSMYAWMPGDVLEALGVTPEDERLFEHADGRKSLYKVAWVRMRLAERVQQTLVVFAPASSEPVLGRLTL